MAQNIAIKLLLKQRETLVSEKQAAMEHFDTQIQELETAIDELYGKRVWNYSALELFDDTHPDYIRSSSEEM